MNHLEEIDPSVLTLTRYIPRGLPMKIFALMSLAAAAIGAPTYYAVNYVELQPDSPGSVQTGNLNITGTAKATRRPVR
jgi:hypothetical protein